MTPVHALVEDASTRAAAIADLKRRIRETERECDALRAPGHEEDYLRARSTVEAFELQLEARLGEVCG